MSCFADTETSTRCKKLIAYCPQAHRPQTGWNQKVHDFFNKLIYFWLCWVFVAVHGLSLVVVSGGLLFVEVRGLLISVASLVAEHGPWAHRLQ